MRARRSGPVLAVVASILAGCATTAADQRAMLDRAPICCESLAALPYAMLAPGDAKSVKFGDGSPTYGFDSGKSYFFATQLPPYAGPLVLTVESQGVLSPTNPDASTVFRPAILLLDEQFNVTRRIAPDGFKRKSGATLHGSVFINPDNAAERYLVLYTEDAASSEATSVKSFTPVAFSLGGPPITIDGSEQMVQLQYGPAGQVTLRLQRYEPADIAGR